MKRRQFLIKSSLTGAATLAASALPKPAIAQSSPEMKWRLCASWPKSLDVGWGGCETFCRLVGEMTDQKFQIQPFAAGEIVPGLQVLDAVSKGTVEIGHTASYYYGGNDPTFAFGTQGRFYFRFWRI